MPEMYDYGDSGSNSFHSLPHDVQARAVQAQGAYQSHGQPSLSAQGQAQFQGQPSMAAPSQVRLQADQAQAQPQLQPQVNQGQIPASQQGAGAYPQGQLQPHGQAQPMGPGPMLSQGGTPVPAQAQPQVQAQPEPQVPPQSQLQQQPQSQQQQPAQSPGQAHEAHEAHAQPFNQAHSASDTQSFAQSHTASNAQQAPSEPASHFMPPSPPPYEPYRPAQDSPGYQSTSQASPQVSQGAYHAATGAAGAPPVAGGVGGFGGPAPAYATTGPAPASPQSAPQVVYAPVPQKRGRGWIVALVFIVCLFLFSAFCVKMCSDAMASGGGYGMGASAPSGDAIAVVNLDGTIQYDDTACSPTGLKALLDQASADDHVKGLVLRVNSGGGTATAGEEMAEYLREFEKPVVVSSASINASAAYEISSQADYIFVAKSTEIGAIGTAMQLTDLSGLLDMLGVNVDVITSSDSKDSSYGYRPLTDEEREYYQRMVNQINDMFIENVATGRHMTVDEVRALATGMSFTGVDAVENGLADEIGTLEDAMDKAAELAGLSSYEPFDLELANHDLSSLYSLFGSDQHKQEDGSLGK